MFMICLLVCACALQTEYYALTHNPRGQCVVFNNETFLNVTLKNRGGTEQDESMYPLYNFAHGCYST